MTSWNSAHFSLSVWDSVESWPYFLLCKLQLIPYSSPHLLQKDLGVQEENNRLLAGWWGEGEARLYSALPEAPGPGSNLFPVQPRLTVPYISSVSGELYHY